jgi:hypothetical protein
MKQQCEKMIEIKDDRVILNHSNEINAYLYLYGTHNVFASILVNTKQVIIELNKETANLDMISFLRVLCGDILGRGVHLEGGRN